jgi:hypothetical protein
MNKHTWYQLNSERLKLKSNKRYYDNIKEKVVAVSCIECNKIILIDTFHNRKQYCNVCSGIRNKDYYKSYMLDYNKIYRQTGIGKTKRKISKEKRNRNYGFIQIMDNPFPKEVEIDWHHINDMLVIPIPRKIHRDIKGKNHRKLCNSIIEDLYMICTNVKI